MAEVKKKEKKEKKQRGGAQPGAGAPTKYRVDTPRVFADLITKHRVIGLACEAYGISTSTYNQWRKQYPEFQAAVTEAKERVDDQIESKYFKLIDDGNPSAVLFGMRTRLGYRGYSERQELAGADGQPLVLSIKFEGDLSDEEKQKL